MTEYCIAEKEGHILTVTINRPEVMNSLHPPANEELAKVWDEFEADDSLWVGIVTGVGERAFCAGNDLKYSAAGGEFYMPASGFGGLTSRLNCNKPIIAAINGLAFGGGFEIALSCDLIIASDAASFALPEPRVGLAALAGGPQRLLQKVPYNQAMAMLLTGRRMSAQSARDFGLVNEVSRPDQVLEKAKSWAYEILECSPLSLQVTKQVAIHSVCHPNLRENLDYQQYSTVRKMTQSADFYEGQLAFVEKRQPQWQGI